ncbi:GNAT family N-acetyltransferase [Nodosilinea sp. FACHB-131]|uniref:GNAT family N-acetyltransferase n=1 Tax=Cyanophyceae TaxID=3028117 RepID=UPI00168A1830|nr:GNAT family N-acetyltransferase [Nodosilinea sp. FACHB-131]MBD1873242.1 GNAT family N-acetyltransferase [Nodosilinea sp. FACHB-131]
MHIREDDLTEPQIIALLREHLENMHEITPPGSVHALDLERLRAPNITFWTAWDGDDLLGCGALKELDPTSGEIKSMRTPAAHRRKGIASSILDHIIEVARQRGYTHLYLETGAFPAFAPARSLYERYGFEYRGPFGDYTNDPNSSFMQKTLIS